MPQVLAGNEAKARRTETLGVIARTGLPDDAVEVGWRDRNGKTHRSIFVLSYPEQWRVGDRFDVRYDPEHPDRQVYPAREFVGYTFDEGLGEDKALVELVVTAAFLVLFLLMWLGRGVLNLRAARSGVIVEWEARPVLASHRLRWWSRLLLLVPDSGWEDARWQRIMWDPSFAQMSGSTMVRAHITAGRPGRAVVELPDGTRLWPAGRLRKREYRNWDLDPEDLDPEDLDPEPSGERLFALPNVVYHILVAAAGGVLLSLVGKIGVLTGVGVAVGGFVHLWGWYGGELQPWPLLDRKLSESSVPRDR